MMCVINLAFSQRLKLYCPPSQTLIPLNPLRLIQIRNLLNSAELELLALFYSLESNWTIHIDIYVHNNSKQCNGDEKN